jgi:putative nucleotidyltransferase with HDIG domain
MNEVILPQPVLFVLQTLAVHRFEGYVVGGAVRDVLMNRETTDWDFTTNATPEQIGNIFRGTFYDNEFGMVGIAGKHLLAQMRSEGWVVDVEMEKSEIWQKEVLEVTTFRHEYGYTDNRRPDFIVWGKSIEDDVARRDFTINALAFKVGEIREANLGGSLAMAMKASELKVEVEVIDLYQGQHDITKKLVRAVGQPKERFTEDALRMMRAIRFGAQLGFSIEQETLEAVLSQAHLIELISWERKRDELLKIMASEYPADGIMLLDASGLLQYIIPEMIPMKGVVQGGHHIYDVWQHSVEALRACPSNDVIVRLATLLHDVGKPVTMRKEGPRGVTFYGHEVVGARMVKQIGRRLRLTNKQVDQLWTLVRWHMFVYESDMTDAAIRRFIKRVGVENINDMIMLRIGDRKGSGSKATSWRLRELQERVGEQLYQPLSVKDLAVDGTDVMKTLDIPPGKEVGMILNQLFEEVMEESSKNDREKLIERIREIYKTIS